MTKNKRVLILGEGGRENALAWAFSRSKHVKKVFVIPGNAGSNWSVLESQGLYHSSSSSRKMLDVFNFQKILDFVNQEKIDLTVVGDAEPLFAGIVDAFLQSGNTNIFGPVAKAAKIEGSKIFAKEIMANKKIPTSNYKAFSDFDEAISYVRKRKSKLVIKANGLASGKGVFICKNDKEACFALEKLMLKKTFGIAGEQVIIEEYLQGEEISFFALVKGNICVPLISARDYKKSHNNEKGLNTGGMGAAAPLFLSKDQIEFIVRRIIHPLLEGLNEQGVVYSGVLYAGLILTSEGIKVLEFNCRFGDPETQAFLPLLENDIFELIDTSINGNLRDLKLRWSNKKCVTVALTVDTYPRSYKFSIPISINIPTEGEDYIIFHSGTNINNGKLVTNAGRIFTVSGLGDNFYEASRKCYELASFIHFEGKRFRTDIGKNMK